MQKQAYIYTIPYGHNNFSVCYVVHKFKITILNTNSLNAVLIITVRLQPFPTQLAHIANHFSC